ncbi:MAG: YfhO family protein [Clostridia bacterium]|nr:YfhO family protein [Clostridia bacterium]
MTSSPLSARRAWWESSALRVFALAFFTAGVIFLPFMIFDQGYFLFYGDFNVQQIPFYQLVHDAIRNGDWGWNWNTDLGANLIGSYTFYNLTSPFFWLTLPFPNDFVPYLMGPLYMLKFACASLGAYCYLKRYVRSEDTAILGGLLYGFCSFSVYKVFFNHFHEAIVVFPFLLAALDEYMYHRRRGVFAFAVFTSCFVNYYFFVGQVVFCLIYWTVRMCFSSWGKPDPRRFAGLALEAVLGLLMTGVVLLPTILAVTQNNRVNSMTTGYGALVYYSEQRYLHILSSFFFMPDIPARANFTPDSNANWASIAMWLPLFSTVGVFAWLQRPARHWSRRVIGILLLMAFVPILNNAFQLFNSAYYARWYYMAELMWVFATVRAIEDDTCDFDRGWRWTFGITLAIACGIGLMPASIDSDGNIRIGLSKYPERFWAYVAISFVSLLVLYLLLPLLKKNRAKFVRSATVGVMVLSVTYAAYFIALGKTQSYDTHNYVIPYCLNGGADVSLPDEESDQSFYRSDFFDAMDNVAMFWKMPSIQAFHSIVPGSVMEFYPAVGVERGVATRPETEHYALRGLLSVKYLFAYADGAAFVDEAGYAEMPGYIYYDTQNGFDVYRNEAYIPMGFTYEYCMRRSDFDTLTERRRQIVLLKTLVVEDEDFAAVSQVLEPLTDVSELYYNEETYLALCKERRQETCSTFDTDGSGFTADIDLEYENYVFFSVPAEDGWSAQVDGQDVEILPVNVGFMAVRVPAGSHTIEFTYRTPGLGTGTLLSLGALLVLSLYLIAMAWFDRRKG